MSAVLVAPAGSVLDANQILGASVAAAGLAAYGLWFRLFGGDEPTPIPPAYVDPSDRGDEDLVDERDVDDRPDDFYGCASCGGSGMVAVVSLVTGYEAWVSCRGCGGTGEWGAA